MTITTTTRTGDLFMTMIPFLYQTHARKTYLQTPLVLKEHFCTGTRNTNEQTTDSTKAKHRALYGIFGRGFHIVHDLRKAKPE
ncbi:unnamed protein product [Amoebophrya sp. A25]|nr:unnamed protein product [Amoebophrya sp. A25]|eukprot:GSA25T00012361001.1